MRCIVAGRAGYAAARMSAGTAEIQILNGGAVLRPFRQRPHEEHLLHRNIAVKDIALGDAKGLFKVNRGNDTSRDDRCGHVGCELTDQFGHAVTQCFPLLVPVAMAQFVWQVLHETGQHVLAFRSKRVVYV